MPPVGRLWPSDVDDDVDDVDDAGGEKGQEPTLAVLKHVYMHFCGLVTESFGSVAFAGELTEGVGWAHLSMFACSLVQGKLGEVGGL